MIGSDFTMSSTSSTLIPDTRDDLRVKEADADKESQEVNEEENLQIVQSVGKRVLLLPLSEEPPVTARCLDRPKHSSSFHGSRIFESESMSWFKSAHYHAYDPIGKEELFNGNMNDMPHYIEAWRQCLRSNRKCVFV